LVPRRCERLSHGPNSLDRTFSALVDSTQRVILARLEREGQSAVMLGDVSTAHRWK
jgi:hypothetical protein